MTEDAVGERLIELRDEFEKGEAMLAELEREAQVIREQLLRIAGAIQVLEELEADDTSAAD